tara:strand:- start:32382 stop:32762 length:381 start_codon:yes stop_codon:yes gene_type:complete
MVSFCSCGSLHKQRVLKAYHNATENKDMNSRPGYAGKVCTITVKNSVVKCELILETYDNFCFVPKYNFHIDEGGGLIGSVLPNSYFIAIVIEGKRYDDFVFNTYAPAWTVDLNNCIEAAYKQHLTN